MFYINEFSNLIKMNKTQKRSILYLPRLLQLTKQIKQTNHKHSLSNIYFIGNNNNQREHTMLNSGNVTFIKDKRGNRNVNTFLTNTKRNDNEEWCNRVKTFNGLKLNVLYERNGHDEGEKKHHKMFSCENVKLIKRNKGNGCCPVEKSWKKKVKDNMIERFNKEFTKLDKEFKEAEVKCLKKIETAPLLNIRQKQKFRRNRNIYNHFNCITTLKYAHNLSMMHLRVHSLNK